MKSVEEILLGLDQLFGEQKIVEVEPYLLEALKEAMDANNFSAVITIVNELIGFYRDTSQYEKSLYYCEQILPFMEKQGLKGSIHYATTCLNIANAYRAAGEWNSSLKYYEEVKAIYDKILTPTDSLYASYFNNLSLLYQEMGDFGKAVECLKTALVIIEAYGDLIKVAITCSNLAASLLRINEPIMAEEYLNRALKIFVEDGERDFHYGAALSAMGELQFRKENYTDAKNYYQKALEELEKHVGKTEYYYRTLDNLTQIESVLKNVENNVKKNEGAINQSNLSNIEMNMIKQDIDNENIQKSLGREMFEDFYYQYGKPMLENKFAPFLDKIAIGKVGEGSECFGFDDKYSIDHDYGPGFCMWVTKDTYNKIGVSLQEEYEKLPTTFQGIVRKDMETGKGRNGVCIIEDFYQRILGMKKAPQTLDEWRNVEEFSLAAATNGWILKDEEGIFSGIRKQLLNYYPKEIWCSKIAQCMHSISQYGQYNYTRMANRADIVTAEQCRSKFIKNVIELIYLLNRTYAPYYKWMYKGLEKINDYNISALLNELVFVPIMNIEENQNIIESICDKLLEQMENTGLLKRLAESNYLEHYIGQVLCYGEIIEENIKKKSFAEKKNIEEKQTLVDKIVQLEWENFDQVKNEGGRADCQDDWGTFSIMRSSQYLTWTEEMIQSYIMDFEEAMSKGWNLITEKYGRMMESTAFSRYEEIKDQFPLLTEDKKAIIEEIVKIQVAWMEDFAIEYPHMAGNSRVIHTFEDTPYSTSFETYLRGEISTYSDKTLDLYGRFVVSYLQKGKNLTKDIMTNTALLYGYDSLDKAENMLSK